MNTQISQLTHEQSHPPVTADQRQRCEVWTRVMGYHRPVSAFNVGKQSEHRERQFFSESAACRTMAG